jgi:hypothetical protein
MSRRLFDTKGCDPIACTDGLVDQTNLAATGDFNFRNININSKKYATGIAIVYITPSLMVVAAIINRVFFEARVQFNLVENCFGALSLPAV